MDGRSDDDSLGGTARPGDAELRDAASGADETSGDSLFAGVGGLCRTAARLTGVDGAAVAVMTASPSRELVYATDALAQQIDELQFIIGEGPCLDAYRQNRPQLCGELGASAVAGQWPGFAADVVRLGVAAVFVFPLPGPKHPMGVLELYRRTAGELGAGEQESALVCAATVGETMLSNWEVETTRAGSAQLAMDRAALTGAERSQPVSPFTRSQVYVAAGMVAVQLAIPVETALDRLRAYSYANRRSVSAVAADIVARRLSMADERSDDGEE